MASSTAPSAPGTVAHFPQPLDPEPDDQVLEVGAGTGWTAALLSHLVGPHGGVTSVETDGDVAEQAAMTGLYAHTSRQDSRFLVYVLDPGDPGQWAVGVHERGESEHTVYQMGERPLWEEVTDAYFRWAGWGEPRRDRFGMTVTPEGQRMWLDSPDPVIATSGCRGAS